MPGWAVHLVIHFHWSTLVPVYICSSRSLFNSIDSRVKYSWHSWSNVTCKKSHSCLCISRCVCLCHTHSHDFCSTVKCTGSLVHLVTMSIVNGHLSMCHDIMHTFVCCSVDLWHLHESTDRTLTHTHTPIFVLRTRNTCNLLVYTASWKWDSHTTINRRHLQALTASVSQSLCFSQFH